MRLPNPAYLAQAGLTERPRRGHVQITDTGRRALTTYPDRFDMGTLEQYPSYRDFHANGRPHRPLGGLVGSATCTL